MGETMRNILLSILAMLLLAPAAAFAVELSVDPVYPAKGKDALITVIHEGQPISGAEVRVTYRPNSEVLREAEVGVTDASGRLTWSPDDAGMAELAVEAPEGSATRSVSVRFPGPPIQGIVVLLLAGLVLFGGNIRFVSRTLKARR
jgi:hypothetical protein